MDAEFAFFQEVEFAITRSSGERRAEMAKHLADLLSANANRYSDDEMTLIDDVFARLVIAIEESLAGTARNAARAAVQGASAGSSAHWHATTPSWSLRPSSPSARLAGPHLDQMCRAKSQDHLLAISRRKALGEIVTDILVERGDRRVVLSTAQMPAPNSEQRLRCPRNPREGRRPAGDMRRVPRRLPENCSSSCSIPHRAWFVQA